MKNPYTEADAPAVASLVEFAKLADYSLLDTLDSDPQATSDGADHEPRQVFSGHYVPVRPTPIQNPDYVAHSSTLFDELGFAHSLSRSDAFIRLFSGDMTAVPAPLRKMGWACGYALSIYGTEYTRQCPFQTGNGYGDGRAISVIEAVIQGQRWEMQLKGGGRTPFCRGADGRAVLRSSVREFLAQEHMHALGVPTSRSLTLYASKTESVKRPWYSEGARANDPDRMVTEPVAITTRVASSFIRVGQLELFARRARNNEHPRAMAELEKIVSHAIDREYDEVIDREMAFADQVVLLASEFRQRLTSLVANWIRVGFCQGNFNSDNCAVGGFTLDYGPFGFCDVFDPYFQPWTGGGRHFCFLNQPVAAERNFASFCSALQPLLTDHPSQLAQLEALQSDFPTVMQEKMEAMWASKLGLTAFDSDLFEALIGLMLKTPVDYTLFFRELSNIPEGMGPLRKCFYDGVRFSAGGNPAEAALDPEATDADWSAWLRQWRSAIGLGQTTRAQADSSLLQQAISRQMQQANPKYRWREWLVVPAYQQAALGDYRMIKDLQAVLTSPYADQSSQLAEHFYRLKPLALFNVGGVSHYSCSS